jgi:hypothetical protein
MRLIFAFGSGHVRLLNEERPASILVAFPYAKALDGILYEPEYLVLDSGAFTAWNKGDVVDIAAYADWAIAARKKARQAVAVNLDVIPGRPGKTASAGEREAAMVQSLKNADYLRSRGVEVIEVWHQDEPFSYFDELVQRAAGRVVGVSPRNDLSPAARVTWLKGVLGHVARTYGPARCPPTHGFGVTARRFLEAFPFWSADSSTWINGSRFGNYVDPGGVQRELKSILPSSRPKVAQAFGVRTSIRNYLALQEEMTALWERRGIRWSV